MTNYELLDIINSQYNRKHVDAYHRSLLFLIKNKITGDQALYSIDRISKSTASLRCQNRKCYHRLAIEHDPSEFVLERISPDFLYLNDIFC